MLRNSTYHPRFVVELKINISTATLRRIPSEELFLHANKKELIRQLLQHAQESEFTNWINEKQKVNADFVEKTCSVTRFIFFLMTSSMSTNATLGTTGPFTSGKGTVTVNS